MIPELHADERQDNGQGGPLAEPTVTPPVPPTGAIEAQEIEPTPATLSVTPPAPPGESSGTRRRRMGPGWRWALALGLAVFGGLTWFIFGWGVVFATYQGPNIAGILAGVLVAALPAVTCLVAGWLLRSWWGMAASVVVYAAVSALLWFLAIVGAGDMQAWLVAFPLYVVAPAVIMAAIGTIIGMRGAERGGQQPRQGGLAS